MALVFAGFKHDALRLLDAGIDVSVGNDTE
jgi:hypothetical protein